MLAEVLAFFVNESCAENIINPLVAFGFTGNNIREFDTLESRFCEFGFVMWDEADRRFPKEKADEEQEENREISITTEEAFD